MITKEDLTLVKNQVDDILKRFPDTRNSDKELILKLWKVYYPCMHITLIPEFETITRMRRKLQSKGLYLPTDIRVAKRRRINEETYKKYMAANG